MLETKHKIRPRDWANAQKPAKPDQHDLERAPLPTSYEQIIPPYINIPLITWTALFNAPFIYRDTALHQVSYKPDIKTRLEIIETLHKSLQKHSPTFTGHRTSQYGGRQDLVGMGVKEV